MIGSIILSLALVFSLFSMTMYFLNYRGYKNTLEFGRISYHFMAMLVIMAAAFLWSILLSHNYGYKYVYDYSSSDLPLGYLIASFWGGQEGSFMLWLLLSSIVGIILQSYCSKRGDLEPRVMSVFTLVTSFLLVMVSPLFKNPFEYIWTKDIYLNAANINHYFLNQPWIRSFIYTDSSSNTHFIKMTSSLYSGLVSAGIPITQFIVNGKGLNPQLMNFWMQIHPPILFSGFSMSSVPFCFAIAALMKNDYKSWVRQAFPWVLAASGILGLGIMLGGYWAYEMLGWGGYWAWDPVENSSLIPWLVAVASVHTLLVQRKSQAKGGIGRYAKTNLILCIFTYILVLYSTFLTRSGVLGDASVHSFVDPGRLVYLFLIIFMTTFLLIGLGMIIYRWKHLSENLPHDESLLSRELALFTASVVLCAAAIIILVGTSAPIFGHAVQKSFYSGLNIPIAIIIGLLNGLSLLIKWKETKGEDLFRKSLPSVSFAALLTILIIFFGNVDDIMMILLTFSAAFALFVNLEIVLKIIRGNKKMVGAYVAHIGISLFILGVIGSTAYSKEVNIDLVKDVPNQAFGYKMTFKNWYPIDNNKKYAFNIELQKDGKEMNVAPVMYISSYNNGLMREPAILQMFTRDLYLSPLGYDNGEGSHGNEVDLKLGEEKSIDSAEISYKEFVKPDVSVMMSGGNFEIGTRLHVVYNNKSYDVEPKLQRADGQMKYVPAVIKDANLQIQIKKIDPNTQDASFLVSSLNQKENNSTPKEVLSITASIKPFIDFVWFGVLIMVIGFFISVARRLKESLSR
jgi:cytochrome c-type biogenesis protein CcmF